MQAVLFEVTPAAGQREAYLAHAARLRPLLDDVPGFHSIERFQSLSAPEKLLSLSFFEDEAAVRQWRTLPEHRIAQAAGRNGIFLDYRLRIANVARDYGMCARSQAPLDALAYHDRTE